MKLMKKDIRPNERITTFFALESMEIRMSKAQQNFLALDLYDKTGRIKGYLWNNPVITAATLSEKSFVKVRGIAKMINSALIIEVERIRKAEKHEIDMQDFLEVVSGGIDLWQGKLLDSIKLVRDVNCRELIDSFLGDEGFLEQFITSPGGV